ncbi:MAG: CAP domain-containing protein [Lachnospiraceae bacterium]|nr:CAP domain-containing protein [Lachnospiraceae bacterium]
MAAIVDDEPASESGDASIVTVEIMAEVVDIEDGDVLIICDTDGNVYEIEMPESFTDEEKAQYVIGSVLKLSFDIDTSTAEYTIVSDAEVSLVTGTEALEVQSTLVEKGFVIIEFVYDDVLEYYEELYAEITDLLVYSPEEMADATEAAFGTESGSEEWETVLQMETDNFNAYVDSLFASTEASSNTSTSTENSTQTQEKYTYVNNITVEGVVQLTNEYRVSQGVAELTVDETLQQAAQIRAEELAAYGNIIVNGVAHVRLDGSSWMTVLDEVNWYRGSTWGAGENCIMVPISSKYPAESSTLVDGWIASEGHRLNMINSAYTVIGVGVAWNGDTCYSVQLFGYSY